MEALGINIIQIISYILIFFVLYIFASKFVKKVLQTTQLRKEEIELGLKNAKESQILKEEALKEAEKEKQAKIQEAYAQAQSIIDNAKARETHILEESGVKAQNLIKEAASELSALREKSINDGLSEAKDIITLSIKKAFEGYTFSPKEEEKLIEDALKNLKNQA